VLQFGPWRALPATRRSLAVAGFVLAGIVLFLARLRFAATEPLWFDEAFSLAIVARPDGPGFWHEVWLDSNGPAYYLLLRAWTAVFGTSDLALRGPGLLAVILAGLLPAIAPPRGMARGARLVWPALIYCWWGVGFFLDARCYALLLAVSTAQCLAFAGLMRAPGLRRASVWAGLSALAILFHYYALFVALAQGLIYLARHRWAALRTWPAVLAFIPVAGWIAYHAPRLAQYASLSKAWHPPIDAGRALELVAFAVGPTQPLVLPAIAATLAAAWLLRGSRSPDPRAGPSPAPSALVLTAASGALAFAFMLAFALLGSGISPRYLVPLAPALLLGVTLLAAASPRPGLACAALLILCLGVQVKPALDAFGPVRDLPRYEFETAADALMAQDVSDVVFVWDHELAPIMAPDTLREVGGVFFERAHRPIRVIPLVVPAGRDANREILAAATGPRPGLIWMFNREGRTAAHAFPPAIERFDPDWKCLPTADATVGGLGCHRSAGPSSPPPTLRPPSR
jgi:hypothetical protein